jgi:hypothetical protein
MANSLKPTSGTPGSTSGFPIIRAIAEYLSESDIRTTFTMGWFRFPSA